MARQLGHKITVILLVIAVMSAFAVTAESSYALTTNVRVGFCAYMSPYQYVTEDGVPQGFHIDLMKEIADDVDLVLEYIPYETTSTAMNALKKGEVDMVLGVAQEQFFSTNARYSSPLSTANICIVANGATAENYRNGKSNFGNTAVEFGLVEYTYLSNLGHGDIILTGNQKSSIEMLLRGRVKMMVGVKECILWYLDKKDLSDDYVIINNFLSSADFTVAVQQGDRQLCNDIDESLSVLRTSSRYDDLYNKWFNFSTVDYRQLFRIAIMVIVCVLIGVAVFMLISFRRRTARAEAESRLRYSIIESSPAGMVLIDRNHNIEYMNRNAMNLAGLSSYKVGESLSSLAIFSDVIQKAGGDIFEKEWDSKTGIIDFYKKRSKANKEKYRWNIQKMNPYGNQQGALLTVENITTEEREREAAFEKEKNETLNSLIAGIAHEIKNPLTAINASAAMMEKKGHNEKFRQAFTEHIPQEIDRITRLIDNLLDYARPGVSKIEDVSLSEVIRSVYELSKVTAKKTQIIIDISDEDKLIVRGDRDKLKQSLLNLMINSVEATKNMAAKDNETHNIKVECFAENEVAVIRITDDGVGMTAQELERCTMPFWTTKKAGTGIGLALTKQYIEEAGGQLSIDSVKNEFTCVEIQIPVSNSEEGE